jgi:hypothetical protein
MIFNSASTLRQLMTLQQQIIDTPRFAALLHVCDEPVSPFSPHVEHPPPVILSRTRLAVMFQAERHVRAMALTTERLRQKVVPIDGLGDQLQSLSELMLRAARIIVLAELEELRGVLGKATQTLGARMLCWGAFDSEDDLIRRVRSRLHLITRTWTDARDTARTDRGAYRNALRTAHARMRHLGSESAFGALLRDGEARSECPALQEVCRRMRDALQLRVDVDVDAVVIVHRGQAAKFAAERLSLAEAPARGQTSNGAHVVPSHAFGIAMDDLVAVTIALASAISDNVFIEARRLRGVLERALGRAWALGAQLPAGSPRAEALHQLAEMHAIAAHLKADAQ